MLTLYRSETSASLRRIPMWLMGSNGTTPATGEAGGQPQINWIARGAATIDTTNALSLVSANAGEYFVELEASDVSALGVAAVHYRSATAIPNSTYFQVVNYDSGDSVRLGLFALPDADAEAAGGLITRGTGTGQLHVSSGSVGLLAQTHSEVTIQGITRIDSSVTIADAEYSAVTMRLGLVDYSGATVGVGNIAPDSYSGVTVEVSNIVQSVRSLIADDILLRDLATGQPGTGGRSVQNALRPLRNRVAIGGSTITVYTEDDSTSAWTGSVTTTDDTAISSINPLGGSA